MRSLKIGLHLSVGVLTAMLWFISPPPCAAGGPEEGITDAAEVLEKQIEATGSRSAYEALKTRVSKTKLEFKTMGFTADATYFQARPGNSLLRLVGETIGTFNESVLDGVAWELSSTGGPRLKVGAERAGAMRDAAFDGILQWRNTFEKVLEECTTVAEAVEVFGRYDQSRYDHSQLMFADRTGDAVLIDANNVYRKKGRYLLATNFRRTDKPTGPYPCQRFRIADRMLGESSEISLDLSRKILAATHMEDATPTQYSTVFDLKNRQIHLYYFHNFEHVVTIDVQAELTKGWHAVDLASLFPATYASGTYVSSLKESVTGHS